MEPIRAGMMTAVFMVSPAQKSWVLNGDLERLIAEGKEKELASGLIASVQALINDVDFIYWLVNGKRYFVTDEPGDSFENALDEAVREHCEGVRNDNV